MLLPLLLSALVVLARAQQSCLVDHTLYFATEGLTSATFDLSNPFPGNIYLHDDAEEIYVRTVSSGHSDEVLQQLDWRLDATTEGKDTVFLKLIYDPISTSAKSSLGAPQPGLSTGAKVAIALFSILAIAGAVVGGFFLWKKHRGGQEDDVGFDDVEKPAEAVSLVAVPAFSAGSDCKAPWDDGHYYDAKVVAHEDGGKVRVLFPEYDQELVVLASQLKDSAFQSQTTLPGVRGATPQLLCIMCIALASIGSMGVHAAESLCNTYFRVDLHVHGPPGFIAKDSQFTIAETIEGNGISEPGVLGMSDYSSAGQFRYWDDASKIPTLAVFKRTGNNETYRDGCAELSMWDQCEGVNDEGETMCANLAHGVAKCTCPDGFQVDVRAPNRCEAKSSEIFQGKTEFEKKQLRRGFDLSKGVFAESKAVFRWTKSKVSTIVGDIYILPPEISLEHRPKCDDSSIKTFRKIETQTQKETYELTTVGLDGEKALLESIGERNCDLDNGGCAPTFQCKTLTSSKAACICPPGAKLLNDKSGCFVAPTPPNPVIDCTRAVLGKAGGCDHECLKEKVDHLVGTEKHEVWSMQCKCTDDGKKQYALNVTDGRSCYLKTACNQLSAEERHFLCGGKQAGECVAIGYGSDSIATCACKANHVNVVTFDGEERGMDKINKCVKVSDSSGTVYRAPQTRIYIGEMEMFHGWDYRKQAATKRVFKVSYGEKCQLGECFRKQSDGKGYFYPDQAGVRYLTSGCDQTTVTLSSSTQSSNGLTNYASSEFSAKAGFTASKSVPGPKPGSGRGLPTFPNNARNPPPKPKSPGQASVSGEMSYGKSSSGSNDRSTGSSSSQYEATDVTTGSNFRLDMAGNDEFPLYLSTETADAITSLPKVKDSAKIPKQYYSFIEEFGTHYLIDGEFGMRHTVTSKGNSKSAVRKASSEHAWSKTLGGKGGASAPETKNTPEIKVDAEVSTEEKGGGSYTDSFEEGDEEYRVTVKLEGGGACDIGGPGDEIVVARHEDGYLFELMDAQVSHSMARAVFNYMWCSYTNAGGEEAYDEIVAEIVDNGQVRKGSPTECASLDCKYRCECKSDTLCGNNAPGPRVRLGETGFVGSARHQIMLWNSAQQAIGHAVADYEFGWLDEEAAQGHTALSDQELWNKITTKHKFMSKATGTWSHAFLSVKDDESSVVDASEEAVGENFGVELMNLVADKSYIFLVRGVYSTGGHTKITKTVIGKECKVEGSQAGDLWSLLCDQCFVSDSDEKKVEDKLEALSAIGMKLTQLDYDTNYKNKDECGSFDNNYAFTKELDYELDDDDDNWGAYVNAKILQIPTHCERYKEGRHTIHAKPISLLTCDFTPQTKTDVASKLKSYQFDEAIRTLAKSCKELEKKYYVYKLPA